MKTQKLPEYIRTIGNDRFKVCPHIEVSGRADGDSSEYTEHVVIYCRTCRKKYIIGLLIN